MEIDPDAAVSFAATHAPEVLAAIRDDSNRVEICDWLARHTMPDGGESRGLSRCGR
ncbi:hypothetical protein ABH935_000396 [Catenulispora sp. GAS73]|uniref:hypothetical protein n=1 Tax=Catenulispora sp. GAS73 TaxID=3156269 RepID=UPI003514641B